MMNKCAKKVIIEKHLLPFMLDIFNNLWIG